MAANYGSKHRRARDELLSDDPLCVHCGTASATVADHQPPLALHDHEEGTGCCEYFPSCSACSYKQAGDVKALAAARGREIGQVKLAEPEPSPGPDDPCWRVDWLLDLLDVPSDATWPRWMSRPHPEAVGSYGAEFELFALDRSGLPLRWWQSLVARRLLEHDDEGRLVWMQFLFSVARQLGKTHLVGELMIWTMRNARRFWHADDVMLVSRTLKAAEDGVKHLSRWAREADGYHPRNAAGSKSIEFPGEGSEFMIRAINSAYGSTLGFVIVDEAWDVAVSDITEGVEPTLLGSEGMLGYTSTAHRKATGLLLNWRSEAFSQIDEPDDLLLMEWASDRSLPVDDRDGWRQASPVWTRRREKMMEKQLRAARNGEVLDADEPDPMKAFEAQYLNRWPVQRTKRGPGEPFLAQGAWAAALVTQEAPQFQRVAAMEDNYGRGAAVAVAGVSSSERIAVTGKVFEDRAEAFQYLLDLGAETTLVGASLSADPSFHDLTGRVETRGSRERASSLSTARALTESGFLTHDGAPELADQVLECRLRSGSAGLAIASAGRHDLVHAMAWAVAEVDRQRGVAPGVW